MSSQSFGHNVLYPPTRPLLMLTTAYILSVGGLATANHLHFYKDVYSPWVMKESPSCSNKKLCPDNPGYTWGSYFDRVLDLGGQSFVFGGYALDESRILQLFSTSWNETDFLRLSEKVKAKGGSILARLEIFDTRDFNEPIFVESVQDFVSKYPVSGFSFGPFLAEIEMKSLQKFFEALRKLHLTSALAFSCNDWQAVEASGLARIADLNFVALRPRYEDLTRVFNTDSYTREAINNATRAGAKPEGMIVQVPLLARRSDFPSDEGYSSMVYDYNADPKGNGSVIFNKTTQDGYYFFSQTRLVDKIPLAQQYNLRGIMLEGGAGFTQDLFHWDKSSLFYALATNIRRASESTHC
ncbi:hypothetical protein FOL47_000788 [Perkinsus chesapeaki]|uniref:Chitinase n=1 Tax=Perkinsus chesapeaki TaxID=330153 RepID=A0A7J6ML29_PERCH|nr:hypothetical protein FOL47_000788 [Perkinsus chesapeaki]